MFNTFFKREVLAAFSDTQLHDQDSFYTAFLKDLSKCQHEAIIESPFINRRRLQTLLPTIQKLKKRRVRVVVNTRNPLEADKDHMRDGSLRAIAELQQLGVQVLFTGGHHRKLAIIDRKIL